MIGLADAARGTSRAAVAPLHEAGVGVVMLSGDNRATARRIVDQLGIAIGAGTLGRTRLQAARGDDAPRCDAFWMSVDRFGAIGERPRRRERRC